MFGVINKLSSKIQACLLAIVVCPRSYCGLACAEVFHECFRRLRPLCDKSSLLVVPEGRPDSCARGANTVYYNATYQEPAFGIHLIDVVHYSQAWMTSRFHHHSGCSWHFFSLCRCIQHRQYTRRTGGVQRVASWFLHRCSTHCSGSQSVTYRYCACCMFFYGFPTSCHDTCSRMRRRSSHSYVALNAHPFDFHLGWECVNIGHHVWKRKRVDILSRVYILVSIVIKVSLSRKSTALKDLVQTRSLKVYNHEILTNISFALCVRVGLGTIAIHDGHQFVKAIALRNLYGSFKKNHIGLWQVYEFAPVRIFSKILCLERTESNNILPLLPLSYWRS